MIYVVCIHKYVYICMYDIITIESEHVWLRNPMLNQHMCTTLLAGAVIFGQRNTIADLLSGL